MIDLPGTGLPNWSFRVMLINVWVSPSAGEVETGAVMVDKVAEGAEVSNFTVGCAVIGMPSVVSVAVKVTFSDTVSVNWKVT